MALVWKFFDSPSRKRGWPNRIWTEVVRIDLKNYNLFEGLALDRLECWKRFHAARANIFEARLL